MSQNITWLGSSYTGVEKITLPKTGGGTAPFTDVSDTTAQASDVSNTKYFYTSAGVRTQGTNSGGGGGGLNTQVYIGHQRIASQSYVATDLTLKVAQSGKYTVSWTGVRSSTSGTSGSRLSINDTDQTAYTTFLSDETRLQVVEMTNVSLSANDTIVVKARSRSNSYYMTVANLIIKQTS